MHPAASKRHRQRQTIGSSNRSGFLSTLNGGGGAGVSFESSLRSSTRSQAATGTHLSPVRSLRSLRASAPGGSLGDGGSVLGEGGGYLSARKKEQERHSANNFFHSDLSNMFSTQNFRVQKGLFRREEGEKKGRYHVPEAQHKMAKAGRRSSGGRKKEEKEETQEERVQKIGEALKHRLYTKFDRIRQMFRACDRDNDGFISVEDFEQVLDEENFRISKEDMSSLLGAMDTAGTGFVDYKEFINFFQKDANEYKAVEYAGITPILRILREFAQKHSELRHTFRRFDEDKSGSISVSEFQRALSMIHVEIHPTELSELIKTFDSNGDGVVNYEEFVTQIESIDPKAQLLRPPKWRHDIRRPRLKKKKNHFRSASVAELEAALHEKIHNARRRIKKAFDDFDYDQDGQISYDEFRVCLDRINLSLSENELRQLWRVVDTDNSGKISLDEFVARFHDPPVKSEKMNIKGNAERVREAMMANSGRMAEMFAKFDTSGDGLISTDEFLEGLKSLDTGLSDEELNMVIKYVDKSGDGYINFDEFELALSFRVEFETSSVDPFEVRRAMGLMRQEKGVSETLSPTAKRRAEAAILRQHENVMKNEEKLEEVFRSVAQQGDSVRDLQALRDGIVAAGVGIDENDANILIRATLQYVKDRVSSSTTGVAEAAVAEEARKVALPPFRPPEFKASAGGLGEPGATAAVDAVRALGGENKKQEKKEEEEEDATALRLVEPVPPPVQFSDFRSLFSANNTSFLPLDRSRVRFPIIGSAAVPSPPGTAEQPKRGTKAEDESPRLSRSAHSLRSSQSLSSSLVRRGRFDHSPFQRDTSHVIVPQPGTAAFLDKKDGMKRKTDVQGYSTLDSNGVTMQMLDERRKKENAVYEAKLHRRRVNEERVVGTYTTAEKLVLEKGQRRVDQRTNQQLRYLHAMGAV